MNPQRRIASLLCGMALCLPWLSAHAQGSAAREVVRGTVVSIDGPRLTVRQADGTSTMLQLPESARVIGLSKASLDKLPTGAFIGTAAAPGANGELVAQEVHIFPESMRGTGEGHRPYNRGPQSTMTNATVSAVSPASAAPAGRSSTMTNATVSAAAPAGTARRLTLTYKDGDKQSQQTVLVPANVPIVMLEPADRSLLTPGAHVLAIATRGSDGTLTASAVNVGKNGLVPPM